MQCCKKIIQKNHGKLPLNVQCSDIFWVDMNRQKNLNESIFELFEMQRHFKKRG